MWALDHESFARFRMDGFGRHVAELDRLDITFLDTGVKYVDHAQSETGHRAHVQVFVP